MKGRRSRYFSFLGSSLVDIYFDQSFMRSNFVTQSLDSMYASPPNTHRLHLANSLFLTVIFASG